MKKEYTQNELLSALKLQDEDAYTYFFEQYYRRMVTNANRYVRQDIAEDIAVENLHKAMKIAGNFQTLSQLAGYTYQMVRNASIDEQRKQARREETRLPDPSIGEEETSVIDVENQYIELMDVIDKGMPDLSENERKVIEDLYFRGKSIRQIAEEMGIKHNTISKIKQRAIEYLRSLFNL